MLHGTATGYNAFDLAPSASHPCSLLTSIPAPASDSVRCAQAAVHSLILLAGGHLPWQDALHPSVYHQLAAGVFDSWRALITGRLQLATSKALRDRAVARLPVEVRCIDVARYPSAQSIRVFLRQWFRHALNMHGMAWELLMLFLIVTC